MSWRAFAGRNISRVWVFADPTAVSPGQASHGVTKWYNKAFGALKELNPTMPLCIRGVKGTPAVINVHYGATEQQNFNVEGKTVKEIDTIMEKAVLMGEYAERDRQAHTQVPFVMVDR
ncbi:unnamed protein product [Symbiodinium sp. KB8]|nr:unnamed protein product [Symbiodinium sp. KB8]